MMPALSQNSQQEVFENSFAERGKAAAQNFHTGRAPNTTNWPAQFIQRLNEPQPWSILPVQKSSQNVRGTKPQPQHFRSPILETHAVKKIYTSFRSPAFFYIHRTVVSRARFFNNTTQSTQGYWSRFSLLTAAVAAASTPRWVLTASYTTKKMALEVPM